MGGGTPKKATRVSYPGEQIALVFSQVLPDALSSEPLGHCRLNDLPPGLGHTMGPAGTLPAFASEPGHRLIGFESILGSERSGVSRRTPVLRSGPVGLNARWVRQRMARTLNAGSSWTSIAPRARYTENRKMQPRKDNSGVSVNPIVFLKHFEDCGGGAKSVREHR